MKILTILWPERVPYRDGNEGIALFASSTACLDESLLKELLAKALPLKYGTESSYELDGDSAVFNFFEKAVPGEEDDMSGWVIRGYSCVQAFNVFLTAVRESLQSHDSSWTQIAYSENRDDIDRSLASLERDHLENFGHAGMERKPKTI